MTYLTVEQVLLIHSMVIDETGGLHGLRDRGRFLSAVESPKTSGFGREYYPSLFEKAAVYARSIILDYPFLDGNKRTGMTAAFIFLENNGFEETAKRGEIEMMALTIATKKPEPAIIATWLKKHVRESS